MNKIKNDILKLWGREPQNMDEMANCIIAVINNTTENHKFTFNSTKGKRYKVIGFHWNLKFGDVSNSHECPINGVTNWGGRKTDAPLSYPGWGGRVWIRLKNSPVSFASDAFDNTLTYPGTGGAGSYDGPWSALSGFLWKTQQKSLPNLYSWDYRFFIDDWPGIKAYVEKQKMIGYLSDRTIDLSHKFQFDDEETKENDNLILNNRAVQTV